MFINNQIYQLTFREEQILRLIAEGNDINSISKNLNLSTSTIKNHKTHILKKLNAQTSAEAVYIGCKEGILK